MLIKQEVEEKELEVKVEEEKVMPCSAGASTGGQTLSTPRSNQPEEVKPTPKPFLQCPDTPPFPNLSTPFYTHNNTAYRYQVRLPLASRLATARPEGVKKRRGRCGVSINTRAVMQTAPSIIRTKDDERLAASVRGSRTPSTYRHHGTGRCRYRLGSDRSPVL